jgi:hypothetical protein
MRARPGAQVLLLDLDPQGSVTDWAKRRAAPDPIVLQALPGNLSAYLDQAREDGIDLVVIDTPPHAGATIDAAVRAADLVVIPIRPGPFDIAAAAGTVEILRQVGRTGPLRPEPGCGRWARGGRHGGGATRSLSGCAGGQGTAWAPEGLHAGADLGSGDHGVRSGGVEGGAGDRRSTLRNSSAPRKMSAFLTLNRPRRG